MTFSSKTGIMVALLCTAVLTTPLFGQTSTPNGAVNMWGTVPGGVSVPGAVDSAIAHYQNGATAAQVNAAKIGALYGNGQGGTIQAIGSENIVSASIIGNGSVANITANPSATNNGQVTNTGQMGKTLNGNQN